MKTNRLEFTTDFDALNNAYVFICFTWQKSNQKDRTKWANSYHLDELLTDHRAEACLYRYGKYAYALFKRDHHPDIEKLRQTIAGNKDYAHIKVEIAKATATVEPNKTVITGAWLYQLLFNALANSDSHRLAFHNLNGKLIYFPDGNPKQKTITAHDIILNKDSLTLVAKAVTYQTKANIFYEEKDKLQKQKKLAKPGYTFYLNTLKRAKTDNQFDNQSDNNADWKKIYIQAGVDGTKCTSNALSIKNHNSFLQSRMGILYSLYQRFNERYQGLVSASWHKRVADSQLKDRFRLLKTDRQFQKIAQSLQVRILDKIDDANSQVLVADMQATLATVGIKATLGKRESQHAHHICLVKPKASYTNAEDDPYRRDERYITQHMTDENYQHCLEADQIINNQDNDKTGKQRATVLKNLLKEMWIKQDVIRGQIHLFEYDQFALAGKWVFGTIADNNYHMLEIDSNGKFNYFCQDSALLFSTHPYTKAIDLVVEANKPYKDNEKSGIEAFIISPNQDINIIVTEGESALPDLSQVDAELRQYETSLPQKYRNGANLATLLDDLSHPNDESWQAFIQELINHSSSLDKNSLKKIIRKHYHTSTNTYKNIRSKLLDQGVVLSFSKSKGNLFKKMGDLFSIKAGKIDDGSAWYSVGQYHTSFQQTLPHMVNLRLIKSLQGENLYQDILPLLDVDFVRYNSPTVLPFPMKYLREMIKLKRKSAS